METEKVILRISSEGELLGQYNNVKHAARIIHGHFQCIYNAIWTKILYKESFWQYGFIKKEPKIITQKKEEKIKQQEVSCLKCDRKFLTYNKRTNHVCPDCNIINDNLWENNTIYKIHSNV